MPILGDFFPVLPHSMLWRPEWKAARIESASVSGTRKSLLGVWRRVVLIERRPVSMKDAGPFLPESGWGAKVASVDVIR